MGLRGTSKPAVISAQRCGRLGATFSLQWFLGFHDNKAFGLSYSALLQSPDLLHHNIPCIIKVSLYMYTRSIWLQMVLEFNLRSTWRHQLWELWNALGGRCGGKLLFLPSPFSCVGGNWWWQSSDTGITETKWGTVSINLASSGVDRHHHIIPNTPSIFPSSWSYALLLNFHKSTQLVWFLTDTSAVFIDPCNLCSSLWPGTSWYTLTIFLHSSSQNHYFSKIAFRCIVRCGRMLIMGCLPSSATISPHRDGVNRVMHFEAVVEVICRWTCRW